MGRRKRCPVNLNGRLLRYKASEWLRKNKGLLFNVPILCEELGFDPDNRHHYAKVYQGVIVYWRKKFLEFFEKSKKTGKLEGKNRYKAWECMIRNYNQNDAYVFLSKFDKKYRVKYFVQPGFDMLENMDRKRLERQWKGIGSIVDEMQMEDARLVLPDGTRKPVQELIEASKKINDLLIESKKNTFDERDNPAFKLPDKNNGSDN